MKPSRTTLIRLAAAAIGLITVAGPVSAASAAGFALSLSVPSTPVVGTPMILKATGTMPPSDIPFPYWFSLDAIPTTLTSTCPPDSWEGFQFANTYGTVVVRNQIEVPDAAGNFSIPIAVAPSAPGSLVLCGYTDDGADTTLAAASLTLNIQPRRSATSRSPQPHRPRPPGPTPPASRPRSVAASVAAWRCSRPRTPAAASEAPSGARTAPVAGCTRRVDESAAFARWARSRGSTHDFRGPIGLSAPEARRAHSGSLTFVSLAPVAHEGADSVVAPGQSRPCPGADDRARAVFGSGTTVRPDRSQQVRRCFRQTCRVVRRARPNPSAARRASRFRHQLSSQRHEGSRQGPRGPCARRRRPQRVGATGPSRPQLGRSPALKSAANSGFFASFVLAVSTSSVRRFSFQLGSWSVFRARRATGELRSVQRGRGGQHQRVTERVLGSRRHKLPTAALHLRS